MERIKKLREYMSKNNLDAVWITKSENMRYYAGFTGTEGSALVTEKECFFFADFRYTKQATAQCVGYEIKTISFDKPVYDYLKELAVGQVGFEDEAMSVSQYKQLIKVVDENRLHGLKNALTLLRAIKFEDEIELIRQAAAIADKGFEYVLGIVKPGMTEKELALELEFFMRRQGASGLSFDTIVASGIRSSMPHGVASDKVIEANDLLTLDFGCIYKGYCSDMTRTFVVGKASERQRALYHIVLDAQLQVLEGIKPGASCRELDAISRKVIGEAGYADFYGHGLGHGVGVEVHELPILNPKSDFILEKNMIITDEPGIYLPDFGGVRIEDLILVTENGYELLSRSPKEFIEIN